MKKCTNNVLSIRNIVIGQKKTVISRIKTVIGQLPRNSNYVRKHHSCAHECHSVFVLYLISDKDKVHKGDVSKRSLGVCKIKDSYLINFYSIII